MDLKLLKTFKLAVEVQNLRKVAEMLYLTQPAVTSQMRQLEKELGAPLFQKQGRNIQPSAFGKQFYPEAVKILCTYHDSIHKMHQLNQGFSESLTVAISPIYAEATFPSILRQFIEQHPHIELTIRVMDSDLIIQQLESGAIDVALSCLPAQNKHIHTELINKEKVTLVRSHDGYDLESAPPIDALDLLQTKLILTDNHPGYWTELKSLLQYHLPHYKMMAVTQSHAVKRFILEDIGVSFLPTSIIRRELMEGRLLEVPVDFISLPFAETYFLAQSLNKKEKTFLDFISKYML
ncbi:LysR family transcriptional regulator [Thalassobacillus hwangdonensis]|uniref:LysR family transcriptional regulator n=1 Tax=Thalassobacillus hwangdonensis TaxID=546108 RepID=A0ABW3KZ33_9BACI